MWNSLANHVRPLYDTNLPYHNWEHILSGYTWAADEDFDMRNSHHLKAAWLYHDCVYDNNPEKELRSADKFDVFARGSYWCTDERLERVKQLIMYTSHHDLAKIGDDPIGVIIVKMDLHALTDPLQTIENAVKINRESQLLYDCDAQSAAQGSIDFMSDFMPVMENNYALTNDPFWSRVHNGCGITQRVMTCIINGYMK